MATPWKHPDTGVFYLRVGVPTDLMSLVKGQPITIKVEGRDRTVKATGTVQVSLGTKDKREANERFTEAKASLNRVWKAYRNAKPVDLDDKQIADIAERVATAIQSNTMFNYVSDKPMADMSDVRYAYRSSFEFNDNFNKAVNDLGYNVSEASVAKVREAVINAKPNKLKRTVNQPVSGTSSKPSVSKLSITELFAKWEEFNRPADGKAIVSQGTVYRYRPAFKKLKAFLGRDDALAVTEDDAGRFIDHLTKAVSEKTVMGDLKGLNAVFNWAIKPGRRYVPSNPFAEIEGPRVPYVNTAKKAFTDEEAKLILNASLKYEPQDGEPITITSAKRWVPWICAFTGARVGEIIHLQKSSFKEIDGDWSVEILNNKVDGEGADRIVPVHKQLVDLGLRTFVENSKGPFLFYKSDVLHRRRGLTVSEELSKFIRSLGIDRETEQGKPLQPNHAWRHRFKTIGTRHGLDGDARRHIEGRAQDNSDRLYGDTEGLRREIDKLPPIDIK